ncbi:putative haloalkanoic acid dehalogenase [Pisolithus microcarpus]|nr:putative haloalkanoic acid dehalogenase [Pisolithus microcarpus]
MSPSETPGETPRLSDHRALLFDVYGTLVDWETGIYDFLGPFFPGEPREELMIALWEFAALHKLKKYFALVVLSNVDDDSFEKTHAQLSSSAYDRGSAYPTVTPESPFSLILTAHRVGSYKPDPLVLRAALQQLGSCPDPSLPSNPAICVDKSHVLTIANSLRHDILPSMQEGLRSVWISRHGEGLASGRHPYTWRFETLGGLADAVDAEIGNLAV